MKIFKVRCSSRSLASSQCYIRLPEQHESQEHPRFPIEIRQCHTQTLFQIATINKIQGLKTVFLFT